jgi:hypothetical protein
LLAQPNEERVSSEESEETVSIVRGVRSSKPFHLIRKFHSWIQDSCPHSLLLCRSSALSLCCCAFQIALSSPDFFCQRYAAMGCGCGQLASNKSIESYVVKSKEDLTRWALPALRIHLFRNPEKNAHTIQREERSGLL